MSDHILETRAITMAVMRLSDFSTGTLDFGLPEKSGKRLKKKKKMTSDSWNWSPFASIEKKIFL